jgi:hypothetical protein
LYTVFLKLETAANSVRLLSAKSQICKCTVTLMVRREHIHQDTNIGDYILQFTI